MPVPTLFELAKRKLIQNIDMLTDIGDLPYSFLEPILHRIENPDQLKFLEETCPQLRGETGDIWLRFIKRDVAEWDKKPHTPSDPRNWWKVYRKLIKEADAEKLRQEEELRARMQGLKAEREGNQTKILDARTGVNIARRRVQSSSSSGWGARTGAPPKGKTAMEKLKRAVWDTSSAKPKAAKMPMHLLQERKGIVKQAPRRMIEQEQERKMIPPRRGVYASASGSASTAGSPSSARTEESSLAAREARLNALKNGRTVPSPASTSPAPLTRASLPTDKTYSAPRLGARPTGAPGSPAISSSEKPPVVKRKRNEASVFMAQKRR